LDKTIFALVIADQSINMVLPGHLAGGYLAATALIAVFHPDLSTSQINCLLIIGTLAGELPDIDLIFFNLAHRKNQNIESHRNYLTHMPLFWILISMIIVSVGFIFNSVFIEYLGWITLAGTWSHLILDSIEYGISWLAPISKKNFAIKKNIHKEDIIYRQGSLLQHFHFITTTYWKTTTIWIEILVSITALTVFFKSF